jgi:pilus assembly protein CpaE
VLRVLVIHADASTRRSIDHALHRVSLEPVSVYEAPSLTEGLRRSGHVEPDVVLADLSEEPSLALEVAREVRRPDRLIVGLYNPLILTRGETDFFRRAARAGVGDFIPLPVSDHELGESLAAAPVGERQPRPEGEGRLISFFSHKGGVGTTTLAVNTAAALAASDKIERGVALCDAVVQLGTAADLLGLAPDRDLADVARDIDDLGAISSHLITHEESGLGVLASPRDPRGAEQISPEILSRVLIRLRRRFGLVVVDTPSRLDLLSLAVLDLSDSIFVVTEAVAPSLLATARLLELLEGQGLGGERVRLVLGRHAFSKADLPARSVTELLGRSVDHVIAAEDSVRAAASRGVPPVLGRPETDFTKGLRQIADEVLEGILGGGREQLRPGAR